MVKKGQNLAIINMKVCYADNYSDLTNDFNDTDIETVCIGTDDVIFINTTRKIKFCWFQRYKH